MKNEPLVSILTPCYNGENYIGRFLNSILNQTYSNIELIIVDDGSIDRTKKIIQEFKPKFESRGIILVYIYQDNSGQAIAINRALEVYSGEYVTWPDSDDLLYTESIKKRVGFLETNSKFGFVRCDGEKVLELDLENKTGNLSDGKTTKTDIFLDLITERTYLTPGCYLVRTKALMDSIPTNKIYETRAGQNWQLLLPLAYNYECGFLEEILFTYVVRENSHSHRVKDLKRKYERCFHHEDVLVNTIKTINMEKAEKNKILILIEEKYIRKKFRLLIEMNEINKAEIELTKLKEIDAQRTKESLMLLLSKSNLYYLTKKYYSCFIK